MFNFALPFEGKFIEIILKTSSVYRVRCGGVRYPVYAERNSKSRGVRTGWRYINNYTMKSLILAQDER